MQSSNDIHNDKMRSNYETLSKPGIISKKVILEEHFEVSYIEFDALLYLLILLFFA